MVTKETRKGDVTVSTTVVKFAATVATSHVITA